MTRLEALKELAEKVEAGTVPITKRREAWRLFDFEDEGYPYRINTNAARAYLGSLDAALALHEAVLPGWEYGVTRNPEQPRGPCAYVAPWGAADNDPLGKHADADTPARAWLLAILKALIAQEEAQ